VSSTTNTNGGFPLSGTDKTERGEAFAASDNTHWHAVWTRSHSEELVADQLVGKGFEVFLPKVSIWSRRGGMRHVIQVPMFSSYLFLRDDVDKKKYIEVHKARGVVGILGERWDRLSWIADGEIDNLRQAVDAGLTVMPHPYLEKGQRVRIDGGPLKGIEGFLVENKPNKGVLVLSIELLQRSVAVQIDCTRVVPA
jgi:transcription antitermination factor NusG